MIDLDELRKLAKAATPGEWAWASAPAEDSDETPAEYLASALTGDGSLFVVWVPATEGDPDGYLLTAATGDGPHASMDAEFIAAANPTTILELIERVRRVEAERDAALARVAELEEALTEECRQFARTTVHTAAAMGTMRLTMGEVMVKLGYEGLREKLSRTEARIAEAAKHTAAVLNRLDEMNNGQISYEVYSELHDLVALGLNEGDTDD